MGKIKPRASASRTCRSSWAPSSTSRGRERSDEIGISTGLAWTSSGARSLRRSDADEGNAPDDHRAARRRDEGIGAGGLSYVKAHARPSASTRTPSRRSYIHSTCRPAPFRGTARRPGSPSPPPSPRSCRSVRSATTIAMTGEITLRGKVLPVGGLKEKILAARRAGITTVLVPQQEREGPRRTSRRTSASS